MEPYPFLERGAKRKVVHPHYNFFTYENDLALVQLDEPIDFQPHISPICLPPDNIELVGRNATVTGWGRLSEGKTANQQKLNKQTSLFPFQSNESCATPNDYPHTVPPLASIAACTIFILMYF